MYKRQDPDNPFITQEIGIVEQTGQSVVGQFPNTISREVQADAFLDQAYENDGISYGGSIKYTCV